MFFYELDDINEVTFTFILRIGSESLCQMACFESHCVVSLLSDHPCPLPFKIPDDNHAYKKELLVLIRNCRG